MLHYSALLQSKIKFQYSASKVDFYLLQTSSFLHWKKQLSHPLCLGHGHAPCFCRDLGHVVDLYPNHGLCYPCPCLCLGPCPYHGVGLSCSRYYLFDLETITKNLKTENSALQ